MPTQVGVYKVLEQIGEGGMGQVYRGLDTMLEREVAIKQLRADLAGRSDIVDRFRTEAVTLAKLNHPNIVTLYSFLRQDDGLYMVLELVHGETLDARIRRLGPLPWPDAVGLVIQALRGLEHAHQMNVIHRDLKPANAILTPSGVLKLTDFGIARILETARMTRVGHLVGTLEYMAPEQVQGREGDARSDLYSLGIVLYELLAGRVPFARTTDYDLIKAQIETPAPPLSTFGVTVPPALATVVARALSKAPAERFQSAGEFARALQAALDEAPAARRAGGQTRGFGRAGATARRSADRMLDTASERPGTFPRAARALVKANPMVAAAAVMVLVGLGLALVPRAGKVTSVGSSVGTATKAGEADTVVSGGSAVPGGLAVPTASSEGPGFKMPTGPLLPARGDGPAPTGAEKSVSVPPRVKIGQPVAKASVPSSSSNKITAAVPPESVASKPETKVPQESRTQSEATPSESPAVAAASRRSFNVPFERVWTVSESTLRSLGWDIDRRDRAGGYIITDSRSLEKDNLGVYERSLRVRLRVRIEATDSGRTVVSVERRVFRRERVMWVNKDAPVDLDPRVTREAEQEILAAIGRSL